METMIKNLEFYGYLLLFFSSFGGSFLGIVAAGVLCSLEKLDLLLSIVLASSGNIFGSTMLVCLAKYQRKLFRGKKYARKIALVSLWLKRYGIALIFANKYLYGFKSVVPLVVGVSGYSLKKFIFWNCIASFAWGVFMGSFGFFASNLVLKIFAEWKEYPYVFPLVFVSVLAILYYGIGKYSKPTKEEKRFV